MLNLFPTLHAFAKVNGDAAAPSYINRVNFGTLARTGVGVYTLVPSQPIDALQASLLGTVQEANGVCVAIHTSDVLFTCNIFSITVVPAIAAADLDFSLLCLAYPI